MPHGQLVRSQISLDRRWSVLKKPILASDTLITDWSIPANFRELNGVVNIDGYDKLRLRFFGRDAANETSVVHLSGWHDDGQGMDIGEYSLMLGAHTAGFPDDYHQNVKTAFDDGLTWLEVDTYAEVTDPEGILSFVNIADGPSYMQVDLSSSRYAYIFVECTLGTALSIGAVYIPVG